MEVREKHISRLEQMFRTMVLKNFASRLRDWLVDKGELNHIPRGRIKLHFGVAIVKDDEVVGLFCDKKAPADVIESFASMVNMRLNQTLPSEYDALMYEYGKYEYIKMSGSKIKVKKPKPQRGIIVEGEPYRVFMLVNSLVGYEYDGLKDLAQPLIDLRMGEVQKMLIRQGEILRNPTNGGK